MRVTKSIRAAAAKRCQIAASNNQPFHSEAFPALDGPPSCDLAWDAWDAACALTRNDNRRTSAQVWAEAEAMLRTGWKP